MPELADALDLGTSAESQNGAANKGESASSQSVLASCLAFLTKKSPDLVAVIEAWPDLPEPVKAGILAMVKVSGLTR